MSAGAPPMFSLTVSMVRGSVWYTSVCIWSQRKISRCVRSSDFGGHSIGPLCSVLLPGRTSFNNFLNSPAICGGAPSCRKSDRRTTRGISFTCGFHTPFNSCRYRSVFTPPSRNTGSKRVFPCIAHHMVILGWVRWWESPETWRLSCAQYKALCPFTCQLQLKHASSLNTISSATIPCELTIH